MARSQKQVLRRRSASENSAVRFDREIAELTAAIETLERSLAAPSASKKKVADPAKRPTTLRKNTGEQPRAVPPPKAGPKPDAIQETPTPPPEAPAIHPPVVEPPRVSSAPSLPTGSDLTDPKNFGMMPPTGDLEAGTASPEDRRKLLTTHLAFANQVLHTPRVPAAVWREWRGFEKAARARLHALTAQSG